MPKNIATILCGLLLLVSHKSSAQAGLPTWYWCSNPAGYFPYVKSCSVQWYPIIATLPTPAANTPPPVFEFPAAPAPIQKAPEKSEEAVAQPKPRHISVKDLDSWKLPQVVGNAMRHCDDLAFGSSNKEIGESCKADVRKGMQELGALQQDPRASLAYWGACSELSYSPGRWDYPMFAQCFRFTLNKCEPAVINSDISINPQVMYSIEQNGSPAEQAQARCVRAIQSGAWMRRASSYLSPESCS